MSEADRSTPDDWWGQQPTVRALRASGRLPRILELCNRKPRAPFPFPHSLEHFIEAAAVAGMRELSAAEALTKRARVDVATRIRQAVDHMDEAVRLLLPGGTRSTPWQVQSELDLLALTLASEYVADRHSESGEIDAETWAHCARFSIDYVLLDRLPDVLESLANAVAWWADDEPELAKPNHRNARRLLFIRRVTRSFMYEFGTPMRAAVLELTAAFFDTTDLAEADLSRLAPVKRKPAEETDPEPSAND